MNPKPSIDLTHPSASITHELRQRSRYDWRVHRVDTGEDETYWRAREIGLLPPLTRSEADLLLKQATLGNANDIGIPQDDEKAEENLHRHNRFKQRQLSRGDFSSGMKLIGIIMLLTVISFLILN